MRREEQREENGEKNPMVDEAKSRYSLPGFKD
jgi:hypothetical protein